MNKDILSQYTDPSVQKHITMLDVDSPPYLSLDISTKLALMYLTRAAECINKAYFRMDNAVAEEFEQLLTQQISAQDDNATAMRQLYHSMRTPVFTDLNGNDVVLYSRAKYTGFLNFYPANLTVSEFHSILNKMLDAELFEQVSLILSNRTMVIRQGDYLQGIDYVHYFPEFAQCAQQLRLAIPYSQHRQFNEFLEYQALALCEVNPEYDCMADTLWANLQDNILDFTLTRESYNDTMTESIFDNAALYQKLQSHNIAPQPKDSIGARVGIRNPQGTQFLLGVQNIANVISQNMPGTHTTTHTVEHADTVLDLDIVTLSGCECVGGRCTIAQVLPNDDKLAIKRGGKHKKVYNRQTRFVDAPPYIQYILHPDFLPYYQVSAEHYSVICHETTHTFGPQKSLLGKFTSILEEEKADLGSLAFLDKLQQANIFDSETIRQMIVTYIISNFQKTQPKLSQAHAVERVMILNYMLDNHAIWLDSNSLIHIDFDSVVSCAYNLLCIVVDIQSSRNVQRAEEHVNQYFHWGNDLQTIADTIRRHSRYLIRILDEPLKDYLLTDQASSTLNAEFHTRA